MKILSNTSKRARAAGFALAVVLAVSAVPAVHTNIVSAADPAQIVLSDGQTDVDPVVVPDGLSNGTYVQDPGTVGYDKRIINFDASTGIAQVQLTAQGTDSDVQRMSAKLNVVILLDVSETMVSPNNPGQGDVGKTTGTRLTPAKNGIYTIINDLIGSGNPDNNYVSVVSFAMRAIFEGLPSSAPARTAGGLTAAWKNDAAGQTTLNTAVKNVAADLGTNIQGALYAASQLLLDSNMAGHTTADGYQNVVILLTDGMPTVYNTNISDYVNGVSANAVLPTLQSGKDGTTGRANYWYYGKTNGDGTDATANKNITAFRDNTRYAADYLKAMPDTTLYAFNVVGGNAAFLSSIASPGCYFAANNTAGILAGIEDLGATIIPSASAGTGVTLSDPLSLQVTLLNDAQHPITAMATDIGGTEFDYSDSVDTSDPTVVSWNIGTLVNKTTYTLTYYVQVKDGEPAGTILTNGDATLTYTPPATPADPEPDPVVDHFQQPRFYKAELTVRKVVEDPDGVADPDDKFSITTEGSGNVGTDTAELADGDSVVYSFYSLANDDRFDFTVYEEDTATSATYELDSSEIVVNGGVSADLAAGSSITIGDSAVVTLTNTKLTKTLTVNYVDADGNLLEAQTTPPVKYGQNADYDASGWAPAVYDPSDPASIITIGGKKYIYKLDNGDPNLYTDSDPETGTMDDNKVVQYVLEPLTYTLTVEYVDADGNVLDTVIDKEPADADDPYDTSSSEPVLYDPSDQDTIITIGGKDYKYTALNNLYSDSDPASGTMDGDKVVKYVLEPLQYTLTVNWVDPDGNILETPVDAELYDQGDSYDASGDAPAVGAVIEVNGRKYKYPSAGNLYGTSDAEAGSMGGDKIVNYLLVPVTHTLTVNYVDPEGNILETVVNQDPYDDGDAYDTAPSEPGQDEIKYGDVAYMYEGNISDDSDATSGTMKKDNVVNYVLVPKTADITVTKTSPQSGLTVNDGDAVSYDITVKNSGAGNALDVSVSDSLDDALTSASAILVSNTVKGVATGQALEVTVSGGKVACDIGTMLPGQIIVIRVNAVVDLPGGGEIPNFAKVKYTDPAVSPDPKEKPSEEVDINVDRPPDSTSPAAITVTKASPQADKTVPNGSGVSYTITVTNTGGEEALNAIVSDTLDSALAEFAGSVVSDSATTPQAINVSTSGRKIIWTIPVIAPGEVLVLGVSAKVNLPNGGDIYNFATVKYDYMDNGVLRTAEKPSNIVVIHVKGNPPPPPPPPPPGPGGYVPTYPEPVVTPKPTPTPTPTPSAFPEIPLATTPTPAPTPAPTPTQPTVTITPEQTPTSPVLPPKENPKTGEMVLSWLPLAALGLGAVIALIFRKRKAVRK